jgi:LPXTG-motif cell wall-anchored protein
MNGQQRVGMFSALAGAAMILGAMVSPLTASAHNQTKDKVTICHATNSDSNPYVSETVAYSSVDGEGHNDHSHHTGPVWTAGMKHHATWGDIIPPVHNVIEHGLNWNTTGKLIWENHCKPVVPTTTSSTTPPTEETTPPTEETTPPTEATTPPTEATTPPTESVTTQPTETTAVATTTSQASEAPIPTETTAASAAPVTTDDVAGESGSLPTTGAPSSALMLGGLAMMGFGSILTALARRSTPTG